MEQQLADRMEPPVGHGTHDSASYPEAPHEFLARAPNLNALSTPARKSAASISEKLAAMKSHLLASSEARKKAVAPESFSVISPQLDHSAGDGEAGSNTPKKLIDFKDGERDDSSIATQNENEPHGNGDGSNWRSALRSAYERRLSGEQEDSSAQWQVSEASGDHGNGVDTKPSGRSGGGSSSSGVAAEPKLPSSGANRSSLQSTVSESPSIKFADARSRFESPRANSSQQSPASGRHVNGDDASPSSRKLFSAKEARLRLDRLVGGGGAAENVESASPEQQHLQKGGPANMAAQVASASSPLPSHGSSEDPPPPGVAGAATAADGEDETKAYARYLGMSEQTDGHLMWIAEAAISAPLPAGWTSHSTGDGLVFFHDTNSGETSWEHPQDNFFKDLYHKAKEQEEASLRIADAAVLSLKIAKETASQSGSLSRPASVAGSPAFASTPVAPALAARVAANASPPHFLDGEETRLHLQRLERGLSEATRAIKATELQSARAHERMRDAEIELRRRLEGVERSAEMMQQAADDVKACLKAVAGGRILSDPKQGAKFAAWGLRGVAVAQVIMMISAVVLLFARNADESGEPGGDEVDPWDVFTVILSVGRGFEAIVLLIWFDAAWQMSAIGYASSIGGDGRGRARVPSQLRWIKEVGGLACFAQAATNMHRATTELSRRELDSPRSFGIFASGDMQHSLDPLGVFECLLIGFTSLALMWRASVDAPQRIPSLVGAVGFLWCLCRLGRSACHIANVANHDAIFHDDLKKDSWSWDESAGVAWCSILVAEAAFGIIFFTSLSITGPSEDTHIPGGAAGSRVHRGGQDVRQMIEAEVRNAMMETASSVRESRASEMREMRDMIQEMSRQARGGESELSTSWGAGEEMLARARGDGWLAEGGAVQGLGISPIQGIGGVAPSRGRRDSRMGASAARVASGGMTATTASSTTVSSSVPSLLWGDGAAMENSSWSRSQRQAMEELERELGSP